MGKTCALSAVDRQKIQQWIAAHGTPQQVALRCRIVLAAAAGESNVGIAERLAVNRKPLRNANIGLTRSGSQHDTTAQSHLLRSSVRCNPLLNLLPIYSRKRTGLAHSP